MSRWYRNGTVSVVNGSTTVNGTLSAWSNQVKPGDSISFDAGAKWYEVAAVPGNTEITLGTAFAESTVTDGPYAINRTSPLWSLASELAVKIGALLEAQTDVLTGTGAPSGSIGTVGSIYIDTLTYRYYGPKTLSGWGDGTRLLVPTGFRFQFDDDTAVADPGTGKLAVNHGSPASATKLVISKTDADGNSIAAEIASWFASTSTKKATLAIRRESVPPSLLRLEVTAGADHTGWVELTVTGGSLSGAIEAGDELFIAPEIVGDKGLKGDTGNTGATGTLSLDMVWTTSVSGDPGAGKTGINNADYSAATVWSVSETERLGANRTALIGTFDDSTNPRRARVEIVDVEDSAKWLCFYITGDLTDQGNHRDFPYEFVGSGTALTNSNRVSCLVTPIGDVGAAGTDGEGYAATSTTSNSIGTGSKTFAIGTGKAYTVGIRARALADESNWVEGLVTSYSGGDLEIDVDRTLGTGTHTDWSISLSGKDGTNGTNGVGFNATSTSSVTVGTGSKTFAIGTNTAYAVGGRARAIFDASNWVEGSITAYTGGDITLEVDKIAGSGTRTSWTFMVAGELGLGGDVTAAAAFATDNRLIRSDGTGKGVQASGITISDSDAVSGVAGLALASGTITNVPTPTNTGDAANKAYVDAQAETLNLWVRKGAIDCSANPNYPAANNGHIYRVSVAGKIGGASGPTVEAGDWLICEVDGSTNSDHATVGSNWGIVQVNLIGALLASDIGTTVQGYDIDTAKLDVAQTWSKPQGGSEGTLASATGWDGSDKQLWAAEVNGGNFTIANPSAAIAGRYYAFYITYATTHAVLLGNQFKGVSTLTFSNTTGAIDHLVCRWNGTHMVCVGARMNIGA